MRYLNAALLLAMLLWGIAYAGDGEAMEQQTDSRQAGKYDVSGLPVYQGPLYRSLDSMPGDITKEPQFHAFHHRGVDEVGYSPLTLDDFRFPVVKRTMRAFELEREAYPTNSKVVWHSSCNNYTVSAYFFTRDMVRDHIQRLIDEYYICDEAVVQQMIDYYAEVTPQCGEAISWVWFAVNDEKHHYSDKRENRYFMRYLANFKDKFYLEFGQPKPQRFVDDAVHKFLYQYQKRDDRVCGPEFKQVGECADYSEYNAAKCGNCEGRGHCSSCGGCASCPQPCTHAQDEPIQCKHMGYKGFTLDPNAHYLYYPRKVVIEDITYDGVAQAYRWKFAWRFDNCEQDLLRQFCAYGQNKQMALVLSDPTWYSHAPLHKELVRNILASMDPQTWGNVWPAGKLPYDSSCCPCPYPNCPGNCQAMTEVGWTVPQEAPEIVTPPADDYVPPTREEVKIPEKETVEVIGRG